MAIKDILVQLPTDERSSNVAGAYALSLASRFGAHLAAAAVLVDANAPGYGLPYLPYQVLLSLREDALKQVNERYAALSQAAQLGGSSTDLITLDAGFGEAGQDFGRLARHFDLTVLEQANPDRPGDAEAMIEAALFDSGRPVLVVPYIHKGPAKFDEIVVAWDMSRPAARAVADAMPFLQAARNVQLVTVQEPGRETVDLPGFNISRHLARHGVKVELRRVMNGSDVANTLLSHVFDTGADLLVMGGYGRSRLREFVLGGTTRAILSSLTLPALMSH